MIGNIEEIKAAANIVDIISDFAKLKKSGSEYESLCPFHKEKTPSFKVSPAKDLYKCFGCGKSGDGIDFLMQHENMNYIQAIKYIANKFHIEVTEDRKTYDKPLPRLEKVQSATIKYFESRGISNNTLLRMGVSESVEWMPKANKEVPAICFNYIKDGELVNIKFRAKDKDFKLHKNSELVFYNLDALENESTAIIVEGEIDCLSMHEAGFYNCVSVPNGAGTGQQQLKYLDNCWQYFEDKTRIIIFTDNDQPGLQLRDELSRRLGRERCFMVEYPEGCKDANEILLKHGKPMLQSMVEQVKAWPIFGITNVEDVYPTVLDYYLNGYPKAAATGIVGLDELITFAGGTMTIITGAPSSGKSEFLDYIVTRLARRHGWKFAVCSMENPTAIHVTKFMEKFIGKAFDFRKNPDHRMNKEEFEDAILMTDDHFCFVNTSQVDVSVEGLIDKLTEVVKKKGIKGVLLDPWNQIEHKIPQGFTETQYISQSLSLLREFATKTDVHLFIVAHPTKLKKDPSGQYPVATLYDCAGSAHFFNKTDNGLSVYRDNAKGIVTVYSQKIRFSFHGSVGYASFTFDTYTRQYLPA
ncbi:MAG: CHC2 zinc finger domain-containing protein [Bacteroidota bacterium]